MFEDLIGKTCKIFTTSIPKYECVYRSVGYVIYIGEIDKIDNEFVIIKNLRSKKHVIKEIYLNKKYIIAIQPIEESVI